MNDTAATISKFSFASFIAFDLPELQLIYDTAPVGLAFLTPDCRYVQINQRLTEICGISVADHIGRSVRETVPQVAEQVEFIVQTLIETGKPLTGIEVNGQRPDGTNAERLWLTSWHPLKGKDGSVVGVGVVAEEITERKRAENALRELNATLEQRVEAETQERLRIWNVSEDLLLILDQEGKFLKINPSWITTLGWSDSDLIGRSSQWLLHPEDRERTRLEIEYLAKGGRTHRFENRYRHKDGSYRWLSWKAAPSRDRIYAVARDVTELKQAENELRDSRRELARVSRQTTLATMTASIAHEVNQPLSAIVANGSAGLRWLDRDNADIAEARTALQRIVEDGHRASEIIANIRAMFRKDGNERQQIQVRDLIGDVLTLAHGEIDAQRATLNLELGHASENPVITGDKVQLQQVLLNLILNALEAMSTITDRDRLLTIKSECHSQSVVITVADSGTGIDPNNLDRIFEPFFTTKQQGMGMGLSICRLIVEAHGGKLWASSGNLHGCIIHLELPDAN